MRPRGADLRALAALPALLARSPRPGAPAQSSPHSSWGSTPVHAPHARPFAASSSSGHTAAPPTASAAAARRRLAKFKGEKESTAASAADESGAAPESAVEEGTCTMETLAGYEALSTEPRAGNRVTPYGDLTKHEVRVDF